MTMKTRAALVLLLGVAACVRPPVPLQGAFPPTTVGDVQLSTQTGAHVRWGGTIVDVQSREKETCFEIVSAPLDREARPIARSDTTYGRFIACNPGFFDPTIYAPDREVTVVGTVRSVDSGTVGDRHYRFPVVEADVVHLWPVRPEPARVIYYSPWVGVWGYPFAFYGSYGWGYGGYHHFHGHRH
jgi:outer membrane lipoprotein